MRRAVLPGQQAVQDGRVGACHIDHLSPARRARDQGDRGATDAERVRHRGQGRSCGPAIHGALAHPYHERAVVLSAHTGMGGSGPDPYGDAHRSIVPGAAVSARGAPPSAR